MRLDYRSYSTYEIIDNTNIVDGFRMSVIEWSDIKGKKIVFDGDCGYCIIVRGDKRNRGDKAGKIVFKNNGPVMFYGYGEVFVDLIAFDTPSFVAMNTTKSSKTTRRYNPFPDVIDYSVIFGDDAQRATNHTTSLVFESKNILFINEGSVFLGQKVYAGSKAKVYIDNTGDFTYRNSGGIMNNIVVKNTGSFSTESKIIKKCKFINPGEKIIRGSNYSSKCTNYVTIHDCVFRLPTHRTQPLSFGNVLFTGSNKISGMGDVTIDALLGTGKNLVIRTTGDIDITCYYGISSFGEYPNKIPNLVMKNNGQATITYKDRDSFGTKTEVHDPMDFKIGTVVFANSGHAKFFADFNLMVGRIFFENGGDAWLDGMRSMPKIIKDGTVKFHNGGDAHISNMESAVPGILEVKNGRDIYASRNLFFDDDKHINPGGKIFCGDNVYYSNKSFLKRYNIRIEEGFAYVYKGVSKRTKKAKYDGEDTRWKIGSTHTHPRWSPYTREIGKGKYVATYAPKPEMFKSMIYYTDVNIVELKVAIEDLYEWPSFAAKKPEYIGFRKGTVTKEFEVNKDGRLEETEASKAYQARNGGNQKSKKGRNQCIPGEYVRPDDGCVQSI